jgi:hypothetical protein
MAQDEMIEELSKRLLTAERSLAAALKERDEARESAEGLQKVQDSLDKLLDKVTDSRDAALADAARLRERVEALVIAYDSYPWQDPALREVYRHHADDLRALLSPAPPPAAEPCPKCGGDMNDVNHRGMIDPDYGFDDEPAPAPRPRVDADKGTP